MDVDVELDSLAGGEVVDVCEEAFVFWCVASGLTYRETSI
jgi:hypothetical protein